ncbi:mannose-1-phosphate guanylyltransferase [Tautonia sociabilis]|uniref:mannose-1-phosphate guanylyltransferase n=1 Tax=Tautonia sociabilis TaxID=2080755 RepID=A0A432MJS9_9BACT|nr:mannose-1-phosphate guanylyltransferase [Tautonia sociabilis]RUL87376.1 mannose-1-phosphate guanyltransferase [Tautonia sociabilis]
MLHAVIMAGGSGTRFWPKSRRNRPKQLLRLVGDSTMIQQTLSRVAPIIPPERCWVITGEDQAEATREQLPGLPADQIVGEPCPRDTAACVGLAAALVERRDPGATTIVLPADHVIQPTEAFLASARAAAAIVEADPTAFVTFGIAPNRPETGYGYIERGELLSHPEGIPQYRVERFREKPDRATAEQFLATGRFFWNGGIFVWKARAILEALQRHRPALAGAIDRVSKTLGTPEFPGAIEREYATMEKVPIDKAVMEHAENVRVLEVPFSWNDVGDWRALTALVPPDDRGNAVQGPVLTVESSNCIIVADEGKLVAALGVDDLVIVQSGNATLVARKDQLDRLKAMVEGLESAGFGDLL